MAKAKASRPRFKLANDIRLARLKWLARQTDALKTLAVDAKAISEAIGEISLAEASAAFKKAAIEYLDRAR